MILTVLKNEFMKYLSQIKGIVDKKSTMPVLNHFLLDCRKEPLLYATDLDTAIRLHCSEFRVKRPGALAIPARTFIPLISELEGDILLEERENFKLKISAGKVSAEIACLDPQEFPLWPDIEDGVELTIPIKVLKEIIEKTVYAASDSDTRYVFNGILLHLTKEGLRAVGTDGHRLALYRAMDSELNIQQELKVILPKRAMNELRRLVEDEMVTIKAGKNHVLFQSGSLEFLTKVIEGTYPNYEQVIPKSCLKKFTSTKENLEKGLKRVSIISRERSNAIKMDLKENTLKLSASNPDLGAIEEELSVGFEGEPFTIGFNARYLLDSLQVIESEEIIMEFNDPLGPSILRGSGDDSYLSVIMPMRI
ncbi:MAG: DNA polymerase III subunit beta [Thermodesulfovibrionales bacterium]|nr:DNA polymerase III subunit beta [Thermodesulfovibrionales bacterium]